MASDDEIRSLLLEARAASARLDRMSRNHAGQCRNYVGKVYNGGSLSTSGDRYVLTRPISISGNETEGLSSTLVEDTSQSVPVLVIGTAPTAGAIIVADLIDGRWVAENTPGTGGGSIGIVIPGCICTSLPASGYSLTVTFGPGEDAHTYGNAYQDCSLAYYTTSNLPPYMPLGSFPGPGFYSTTTWIDDSGFIDYFRLSCFGGQFSLGIGQYAGGLWQSPGQIFNWAVGSKTAPFNVCSPFLLSVGTTQPSIFFNGQFLVMGP